MGQIRSASVWCDCVCVFKGGEKYLGRFSQESTKQTFQEALDSVTNNTLK